MSDHKTVRQHEVLRVPQKWTEQDRAFVIQLERILDDLYMKFGRIRMIDLASELQTLIREQGTDIDTLQEEMDTAQEDITGLKGNVNTLSQNKADKVSGATNNNFAILDANGNLKDSGHKHSDYLTQHQDISGKADKSATVSTVTYNSTSKKITKTINGNTTDVVDVSTLKSAMAPFTWGQLANK